MKESSVGATKGALVFALVTRVGGWGEAWGGGPWRAGKGGDGGGHQRAVWEQQNLGSLKNQTTGDGGGVGRWPMADGQGGRLNEGGGMGGGVEVAHGGRARGEMGGGHQLVPFLALKTEQWGGVAQGGDGLVTVAGGGGGG